jgi:hypothetical protein
VRKKRRETYCLGAICEAYSILAGMEPVAGGGVVSASVVVENRSQARSGCLMANCTMQGGDAV